MSGPRFHYGGERVKQIKRGIEERTLDRFAELISRDDADGPVTAAQAGVELGFSEQYGRVLLQRLRKRLGPQAR